MVDSDLFNKMFQLRNLTDAIARARAELAKAPSVETALEIQYLQQRRQELRGLLPPIRVVQ